MKKPEFRPTNLEALLINADFDSVEVKKAFDKDYTLQQTIEPAEIYRLLKAYKNHEQENLPVYKGDADLIQLAAVLYAEYAVRTIKQNITSLFDQGKLEVPGIEAFRTDFLKTPLLLLTGFRDLLYHAMDSTKVERKNACIAQLEIGSRGKDAKGYNAVTSFLARKASEYLAKIDEDFYEIRRGNGVIGKGLSKVSNACNYITELIR